MKLLLLRCLILPCIFCLVYFNVAFGQVDIYGYYEPQFSGMYYDTLPVQINYNKLRVDLKSTAVKNTEIGANVLFFLYFGKTNWNVLDFLPDDIVSSIPTELHPYYQIQFNDTFYLDNVYVRLNFRHVAFTAGKQQISLGTGYFTNPVDVINQKDALDPTYEQPGHNAFRLDLYPANRMNVMLLYTPIASDWENSGKLARAKLGVGHFDLALLGYEYQHTQTDFSTFEQTKLLKRMIGFSMVGELLGLGVWTEGSYTLVEENDDYHYEFLVGSDYTFESGLYTMLEYHRNSLGKADYHNYDINDWMRYVSGETKSISQDQVYGLIQYPVTDLIMVGSSAIFSISDQSIALVPMVYYSLFQNVELTLMCNLNLGDEGKAFGSSQGRGGLLRAQVYF